MSKLIKSDGTKVSLGTILFDGSTSSNFTLTDSVENYEYLEIYYRCHNWIDPKSTKRSLKAGKRCHLSDVHTDGNTVYIYEMKLSFSGKSCTVTGCTKVVGSTYLTSVEGTIYRVVGY